MSPYIDKLRDQIKALTVERDRLREAAQSALALLTCGGDAECGTAIKLLRDALNYEKLSSEDKYGQP